MPYAEKLKDPRWQRKRLEILDRDDFTCRICGAKDKTLHVHHIRYFRGRMPWEYREFYLVTLCEDCHETEEREIKVANKKPELVAVRETQVREPSPWLEKLERPPWEDDDEADDGTVASPEELSNFFAELRRTISEARTRIYFELENRTSD